MRNGQKLSHSRFYPFDLSTMVYFWISAGESFEYMYMCTTPTSGHKHRTGQTSSQLVFYVQVSNWLLDFKMVDI